MGIFDNEKEEQLKADALISNDILVKDLDGDNVAIGFVNSDGDIEYALYEAIDGGTQDLEGHVPNLIADCAGFTEYETYAIVELP